MSRMQNSAVNVAGLVVILGLLLVTGCSQNFFPAYGSSGSTPTGGGGTTPTGATDLVYVASSYFNPNTSTAIYSLSGFSVGTGTLTALSGFPLTLPFPPAAIAINPANTLLFVGGVGVIYGYGIASNGSLTTVTNAGNPALANANVVSMDISANGQWLFALDSNGITIDEFQIGSNGLLTSAVGASYAVTNGATVLPTSLSVSQSTNNSYVAASLGTAGDVLFTFNPTTGAMVLANQINVPTVSTADQAVTFDSTGSTLYVVRSGTDAGLVPYTIGQGGSLTAVSGAPFALGNGPSSVLVDLTGKYVYVGNKVDSTISGFTIGTNGVLTPLAGSPYAAGSFVGALGRDNSGKYLLSTAVGGNPDLKLYSFDTTVPGQLDAAASASTGNPTEPAGSVALALTH